MVEKASVKVENGFVVNAYHYVPETTKERIEELKEKIKFLEEQFQSAKGKKKIELERELNFEKKNLRYWKNHNGEG